MHCNACERTVVKVISRIEGVEKFITDMNQHKVIVTGRIDPQKVLKKLKKKTRKRVEIIGNQDNDQTPDDDAVVGEQFLLPAGGIGEMDGSAEHYRGPPLLVDFPCCADERVVYMFNDENVNACSVM
ncbi:hypothetical protein MLD38_023550 [Melastoma candidum]|uniref:Uncharacterized protein n=1 Tax=Melastoma candidum TaxID=119954 RepID=A0ACB9NPS1_9MYRT|nr:hypothetical protein MLD38_023550 [Melastoma candidum]